MAGDGLGGKRRGHYKMSEVPNGRQGEGLGRNKR